MQEYFRYQWSFLGSEYAVEVWRAVERMAPFNDREQCVRNLSNREYWTKLPGPLGLGRC